MQVKMTTSPATPTVAAGSRYSAKVAVPLVEKTVASKVIQAAANEPSPASTYGASAMGDSVPVTPQAFNGKPSSTALHRHGSALSVVMHSWDFVVCRCTASQINVQLHPVLR